MKRRRRRFRPWDPLLPCITFLGCSVPSMPPGESNYCPRCLKLNLMYCSAPISLLQQIQHLREVREEMPCVVTALEKWERHLNFLTPELVVFNIFDQNLDPAERKAMAMKLHGYRHQWHPGDRLIYGKSVPGPNFCTGDAFWPGR